MAIVKCKSHVDMYSERAKAGELASLSGRAQQNSTQYINEQICKSMDFNENDVVLDIGCGDASLLIKIKNKIKSGCGCVPTLDELKLITKSTDVDIFTSYSNNLSKADNIFTKVVCNGVLILLNGSEVIKTLDEIKRVSKNGALVYLGEIPFKHTQSFYKDSIVLWLLYTLLKGSFKQFLRNLRKVFFSMIGKQDLLIMPKHIYSASEKDFIEILESYDFKLVNIKPSPDALESNMLSRTRKDYIVSVVK